MRCSAARKRISEFLDGGLSLAQEKKLQSHLDVCAECRGLLYDFQKISQLSRELPSFEPSPGTWAMIYAGVKQAERESFRPREKRPGRLSWLSLSPALRYAMASLLAIAVIGGLVIALKPWRGVIPQSEKSFEYTVAKLKEAQRYYEKAIAALEEVVRAQGNGLSPELAEVFQRNLQALDKTIQVCQQMVQDDPENMTARTYLLMAYREKVNFLEDYMGIKRSTTENVRRVTS